jgi:hypothetical protein
MKNLPVIAVLSAACLLAACEQPKDPKGEATKDSTDTMVVPPTLAKDAPSEPSMGEPASASQPQPVYPSGTSGDATEAAEPEVKMEETKVVPPTLATDAPSEPSMGEPASASQPQPVYPKGAPDAAMKAEPEKPSVTDEPAADEVMEEGREEIIMNPPTVSADAPSEPSMGEDPSPSQPQPVYPGDAMEAEPEKPSVTDEPAADEVMEKGREEIIMNPPAASDDGLASQPQPVYPDGKPDGM